MQQPLTLKPLNNHMLVELQREYADVIRHEQDEVLKKGVVINVSFSNYHLTGMGGMRLCETPDEYAQLTAELDSLIGKVVVWSEGAESGTVFQHEGKDYAFVSFWQLVGFEDVESETSEDSKQEESAGTVVEADITPTKSKDISNE